MIESIRSRNDDNDGWPLMQIWMVFDRKCRSFFFKKYPLFVIVFTGTNKMHVLKNRKQTKILDNLPLQQFCMCW